MTTLKLTNFTILSTGVDGGHNYLCTKIEYVGVNRNITAFFKNKSDEKLLSNINEITVKGNLIDDGMHQSLLLLDTEIIY